MASKDAIGSVRSREEERGWVELIWIGTIPAFFFMFDFDSGDREFRRA